jgi:peptide deformylase
MSKEARARTQGRREGHFSPPCASAPPREILSHDGRDDGGSRRDFLRALAAGAATAGAGALGAIPASCAAASWSWRPEEETVLARVGDVLPIPPATAPEASVLRLRARELDPALALRDLERRMRATLEDSGGVGLAAPQIGLSVRAILVTLDARGEAPRTVWCVNPRILRRSDALQDDLEGCLSVDDVVGLVRRNRDLLVGWRDGEAEIELDVSGFDARIFQHEIDHLDGTLFTDRLVGAAVPKDLLRPLRGELQRRRSAGLAGDVLTPEQVADLLAWRPAPEPAVEPADG